jgi:hypothetical protein
MPNSTASSSMTIAAALAALHHASAPSDFDWTGPGADARSVPTDAAPTLGECLAGITPADTAPGRPPRRIPYC